MRGPLAAAVTLLMLATCGPPFPVHRGEGGVSPQEQPGEVTVDSGAAGAPMDDDAAAGGSPGAGGSATGGMPGTGGRGTGGSGRETKVTRHPRVRLSFCQFPIHRFRSLHSLGKLLVFRL